MGLGGAGISALAKLLASAGHEVTGCDLSPNPYYESENIKCELGHSEEHIKKYNPDVLIYTSAVDQNCPELKFAREKNIEVIPRGLALSKLFNAKSGIGIAGAHGKTTTSSMTGLIFLKANLSPTVYIGANVPDFGNTNAVAGEGEFFIAELDESDGSFEYFTPATTIITNADWDHVDHFHTRDDFINAFTRFADGRKNNSPLIICAEDEGASLVIERCNKNRGKIIRYGFGQKWEWGAAEIEHLDGGGSISKIFHDGQAVGFLKLRVSGEHNILNALASIAAAHENGIDFEKSANILKDFHGSERRMQIKGEVNNILIIDDYAHHPSEMKATLKAIHEIYKDKRVVLIYQPHRFSRTAQFAKDIAEIMCDKNLAAKSYLMPVYSAGEHEISNSSSNEIIKASNNKIELVNFNNAVEILKNVTLPNDILLTMGAGDVYKIGEEFLSYN